jgi:hypothetical protein
MRLGSGPSTASRFPPRCRSVSDAADRAEVDFWRTWTVLAILILGIGLSVAEATAQSVQEIRIRWDAYLGAPSEVTARAAQVSPVLTLLERRRVGGTLPRQRNPVLSEDQLVVIAVDGRGETVDAQVIPDPRVLRGETVGPTGELAGQVFHHANPECLINLPDDPAILEVRLYHPRWTGTRFILEFLATIALP